MTETQLAAARPAPECRIDREVIVSAITSFLATEPPGTLEEIRALIEGEIDDAGPDSLAHLRERLATAGSDWSYFPPDPLARRIHHLLADRLLPPADLLAFGIEH